MDIDIPQGMDRILSHNSYFEYSLMVKTLPANKKLTPAKKHIVRTEKRQEILHAAESIFQKKGFTPATTEEIAAAAGVSVGTIYNFFRSKDQLYGEVIHEMGQEILYHLENHILNTGNITTAIEHLVRFRIMNFERYQLFFRLLFNRDREESRNGSLSSNEIFAIYTNYMQRLESFFSNLVSSEIPKGYALNFALCFEGFIHAHAAFYAHNQEQMIQSLGQIMKFVRHLFIDSQKVADKGSGANQNNIFDPKQIFITRYDLDRLMDLIIVHQSFQKKDVDNHLLHLKEELQKAKIVPSTDIPSYVITMNSRVKLWNLAANTSMIRTLVFPAHDKESDTVSILTPLGTAMIGRRIDEIFEVDDADQVFRYRIEDLLYQPESAGDYHL